MLDDNHLGWSQTLAPIIMKNPDKPDLAQELSDSFCRTDPRIAKHFARVTFLSDNRNDLSSASVPALILQCSDDDIAPESVGQFMHANMRGSALVKLQATGHCPHMSAPAETIQRVTEYLARA
jgi:sigma-B regulation protein RsbQ